MSSKVWFTFASEASVVDSKKTVLNVKSLHVTENGPRFVFPEELQNSTEHEALMELSAPKSVQKAIGRVRGKFRTVKISLPADLYAKYFDDDENPVFREYLLEQYCPPFPSSITSTGSIISEQREIASKSEKSLSSLVKDIVIEKFGSKRLNASSWIDTLESECTRLGIPESRFWEVIRLFLEGAALDWYQSKRLTLIDASWARWKDSFLDSFAPRGWSDARFAFSFRFQSGSFADYALKKENLLLNFHSRMDEKMKITHIVLGLPFFIQEKIDPAEIESVSKLLLKLNSLDRPARSISSSDKSNSSSPFSSLKSRFSPPSLCLYCSKKGLQHYHSENNCKIKISDLEKSKNKSFSVGFEKKINNVENSDLLLEIMENSKNE